ncbi:MAG: TSCPD domain-containing protein, partial [Omnitrophica bacterium]|nr:TSCPD domain-containing protein [Candidatus Omnitrophota bacterium]
SQQVGAGQIDWDKLARTTEIAVRFLDNVIDMNRYPLPKIEETTKGNRKIGLGVMGFADMLIKLGIPYNSQEATSIARKVMSFILEKAMAASCKLAEERGVFPNFEKSIYNIEGAPRLKNATLTTIAPTGTLSIIANCSSGIEPVFAICYLRKVLDGGGLPEVHPIFEEVANKRGFYSVELMKLISQGKSIQDLTEVPEDVRRVFVTSHDISPEWHIRMQGAFQEFTHNAVSKTVNFPQTASMEDVEKVYKMAFDLGCKGVTIYRDRSRQDQVLNLGKEAKPEKTEVAVSISPRPRPQVVTGTTTKITTGCGNLYITINEDGEKEPFEVFMQMGKAGGCAASQLEAIGRLVSLALRSGVDLKSMIDQLRGIRCPSPSWSKEGRIFSCADAIARVIENRLVKRKERAETNPKTQPEIQQVLRQEADNSGRYGAQQVKITSIVGVCPDCGTALHHIEGCIVCAACGYSRC